MRADGPPRRALESSALEASSEGGTLAGRTNVGELVLQISRIAHAEGQPLLRPSANLTGYGTKFRAEDAPPEIKACADLVIHHGLRKYHRYERSSTTINVTTSEAVRMGACYEVIRDVLRRHFHVELPPDPGLEALPSGHVREAQRSHG